MDSMTIVWLVLAVAMAILEAVTVQLVSIWFVIGSVAACITSIFVPSVPVQVCVFVGVSALALIVTRPLVRRIKNKKPQPTNADKLIGRQGIVIAEIDNAAAAGIVKVGSERWSARSADDSVIPEGAGVTVNAIEGVKLIVQRTK